MSEKNITIQEWKELSKEGQSQLVAAEGLPRSVNFESVDALVGSEIDPTASVEGSISAAPHRFGKVAIGAGSKIGYGTSLADDTRVGRGTTIGRAAVLRKGARVGHGVMLGDDVIVGPHTQVQNGARIFDHAQVGPNAEVGAGATVYGGAMVGLYAEVPKGETVGHDAVVKGTGGQTARPRVTHPAS